MWFKRRRELERRLANALQEVEWLRASRAELIAELFSRE